jgi:tetratricopeptide (TPR) repeat protein
MNIGLNNFINRSFCVLALGVSLAGCGSLVSLPSGNLDGSFILSRSEVRALRVSASDGNDEAAFKLSRHYSVIGKYEKSREWLETAAELGNATAMYNCAYVLSDESCFSEANTLFKKAFENGMPQAASRLGEHYLKVGDYNQAVTWFRRASEQGDVCAYMPLAKLLMNCSQVQDYTEGLFWLRIEAAGGENKYAVRKLSEYLLIVPEIKNVAEARLWLKKAGFENLDEVMAEIVEGAAEKR